MICSSEQLQTIYEARIYLMIWFPDPESLKMFIKSQTQNIFFFGCFRLDFILVNQFLKTHLAKIIRLKDFLAV